MDIWEGFERGEFPALAKAGWPRHEIISPFHYSRGRGGSWKQPHRTFRFGDRICEEASTNHPVGDCCGGCHFLHVAATPPSPRRGIRHTRTILTLLWSPCPAEEPQIRDVISEFIRETHLPNVQTPDSPPWKRRGKAAHKQKWSRSFERRGLGTSGCECKPGRAQPERKWFVKTSD